MLIELGISNLAVIDHARIVFGLGLNALTGETGAGKSIVIDAVGLLMGGRADSGMIRSGASGHAILTKQRAGRNEPIVTILHVACPRRDGHQTRHR